MFDHLVSKYHLHPIVDHFTIALLAFGVAAELLAARGDPSLARRDELAVCVVSEPQEHFASAPGWRCERRLLSYFTGDSEADRLWDSTSPAAQQILLSTDGAGQYLSHAVLGHYLMYAFLILAVWRVWSIFRRGWRAGELRSL